MPLISFSGESSLGPFWRLILDGRKTQTCRKPRIRPVKTGDKLRLYWKCRVPKCEKPIHFIGEAVCTGVTRMFYEDFAFNDDFARRDGFSDCFELQSWFGDPAVYGYERYDVICWGELKER